MTAPEPLVRLIYSSRLVERPGPTGADDAIRGLAEVLIRSHIHNHAAGITGVLMADASGVVQILEGPRTAVEDLFARIRLDARHCDVHMLEEQAVETRRFGRWSMGLIPDSPVVRRALLERSATDRLVPVSLSTDELITVLERLAIAFAS